MGECFDCIFVIACIVMLLVEAKCLSVINVEMFFVFFSLSSWQREAGATMEPLVKVVLNGMVTN